MFHLKELAVTALLASSVVAVPFHAHHSRHQQLHEEKRQAGTFTISITNSCSDSISVGLFQITAAFAMLSMSPATNLGAGESTNIQAPFNAIGMRLSTTADQGTAAQWNAGTLFEFGYSEYAGQTGTAYDLSVMQGSTQGVSVQPENPQCESKSCSPGNCALNQGWTNPNQVANGSPADTTCYYGPTNFAVTFCP